MLRDSYEFLEQLGSGAGGITWRAQQRGTGRQVAIKVFEIRGAESWKSVELVQREAQVLATLSHPRIPKLLEFVRDEAASQFAVVREFIDGESLMQAIRRGRRMNPDEIDRLLCSMLDVMVYLQRLTPPVIHRDIKPHNILWGKDDHFYLVDFGAVSSPVHANQTGSTVVGTFGYMAPEQFRGKAQPSTDLFGLGMTLLHAASHKDPSELPTKALKVQIGDVALTPKLRQWIDRVIEPDVDLRPVDARAALELYHRGSPFVSKARAARRWRWMAAAALVTVAGGGLGYAKLSRSTAKSRPTPDPVQLGRVQLYTTTPKGPPPLPLTDRAHGYRQDGLVDDWQVTDRDAPYQVNPMCKVGETPALRVISSKSARMADCETLSSAIEAATAHALFRQICAISTPRGQIDGDVANVTVQSCGPAPQPGNGLEDTHRNMHVFVSVCCKFSDVSK